MRNEAWTWTPIDKLFEIGAGKTMTAAARSGAQQRPFLRTSNVLWSEFDLSTIDHMSMSEEELADKGLLTGDLLVCEGGEIGRAAVWNGQLEGVSFQNHLHRLRPLTSDTVPEFYAYFLQSAFTQLGMFEGAGNETTIPNLSRNRLGALQVPSPVKDLHWDIVRILDRVREGVSINGQAEAVASALKRAAMRELFTCGLRSGEQAETAFGSAPASWVLTPIGDVVKRVQYGLSIRGSVSGSYPILRMNCQQDGRVVMRNLQFVDLDPGTFTAFRLECGDLLFNRTNSYELVGRTAIFDSKEEAVFASYLIRLTPDARRVHPKFLNYFLNWEPTQGELKKLASRAVGQANINASKLRGLVFPLPPDLDEQREIVEILDAIDQKIDLHKRKKAVLEELFKALLHKLMTGEIRVADLDLSALDVPVAAEART